MGIKVLAVALLIIAAVPLPAWAQSEPSRPSDLQIERRERRVIVLPRSTPESFALDVEVATADVQRQQRLEGLLREHTRPLARRPDLDADVRGGIQQRSLRNALPR